MNSEYASLIVLWKGQSLKLSIFNNNLVNIFLFLIAQKQPPKMFYKKGIPKFNFAKFTGKHLRQSLFFNKVTVPQRLRHRCFPVNFAKSLRRP